MHKDKYGAIGQIQPDGSVEGGDSACFTGHWVYLTGYDFPYVEFFEKGFGGYVRHPDPAQTYYGFGAYYAHPWDANVSRDQLTGILMAVIKKQDYKAMLRIIIHHAAWLFLFAYNTRENCVDPKKSKWKIPDPTLFDIWAMELRGFGKLSWIFWPILCLFDLQMLLQAIIDRLTKDKNDDVISFIGKFLVSREYVPTPISWLTGKILDKDSILERLQRYWCGWRDNCEFYHEYKKKLDKLL